MLICGGWCEQSLRKGPRHDEPGKCAGAAGVRATMKRLLSPGLEKGENAMAAIQDDTPADDVWLTSVEVAQEFPLLTATYLERCRSKRGPPGPPYFKRGPRGRVFYRRSEVEQYLQKNMKESY